MKAPIRVAVVGTGQFGAIHARALAGMPEARLSALVDSDIVRARLLGDELGLDACFGSLTELIEARLADAIVIATRVDTHLRLAEEAIEAGLAVLVEKPLASSTAEICRFQQRMSKHNAMVMVDHLCLFHSLIVPLIARVRETGFRALNMVRHRPETVGCRFPEDHPFQLIMIHDLYVVARLAGGEDPVKFKAWQSCNAAGRVDMSWATLRWRDGRVATLQSHLMLPEGVSVEGWDRIEIFGNGLYSELTTNPAPWTWVTTKMEWPVNLEIHDSSGMLIATLGDFLRACRDGRVAEGCRVSDAYQIQNWIENLYNSMGQI